MRISLDSPDGFSIRFQYFNISLSEAEQASFFARWGDDIQSVISTGFQRIENTLNRVLFLQESNDALAHLTLSFKLDRIYSADEIGHFRMFCSMYLKEPKQKIISILFGSTDKADRISSVTNTNISKERSGIKYGISGGQWEQEFNPEEINRVKSDEEEIQEKYKCVGSASSIGRDEIEFLHTVYSKGSFIRYFPGLTPKDLDEAMFLPFVNKSLAKRIKTIRLYSNGYKLLEVSNLNFYIDESEFDFKIPVSFSEEELKDPWVRVRPKNESTFDIRFFEETPKRMFVPSQIVDDNGK